MEEEAKSPYEAPLDLPGGETPSAPQQSFKPPKRKRNLKKIIIPVVILIILVACAVAALKLLKKEPAPASQPDSSTTQTTNTEQSNVPSSSGTKTFTAETLAVEFNYPDNWVVTEKEGTITVKSPTFAYKSADAGTTNGYFRIYIRKSARDVDSKYIGRAVAIQPTEKITYTNPATSQRKQTELSYFAYDEPTNFAFMMITPGFNLQKSETLGAKYGKEAEAYIIVGGYSGDDNKDDLSFHSVALANITSADVVKQATEIFKSLKVS